MRRILGLLLAGVLMVGLLAVPAAADEELSIGETVIAVSGTDGPDNKPWDYDILLAAILADEVLTEAVLGTGAFENVDLTVFAPTDMAFMRLTGTSSEADAAAALGGLIGSETLRDIVLYHVVVGKGLFAADVFTDRRYKTNVLEMGNGDPLYAKTNRLIDGTGNRVFPNLNKVNIEASNGVIHTVREVLTPPADAVGSIGETVIAVSSTDGADDNPMDFDILLAAVLADEVLTAAVLGTGSFADVDLTVFAPNDAAFLKLTGAATEAEALTALSGLVGTETLRDIVLYHVINGKAVSYSEAFATKPAKAKEVKMANSDYLTIRNYRLIDGTENRVWPKLGLVDIQADNGVIHVVKEVLSPPADT